MTRGEWAFVVAGSAIVLAMIGTVSLAGGILAAVFVGVLLWAMLTILAGPDITERRR
jgi:hypothetical protein